MAGPQSSGFPDLRADESEQLLAYDPPDALVFRLRWLRSKSLWEAYQQNRSFLDPMSSDVIVGYR
jgi:hypothetical protein